MSCDNIINNISIDEEYRGTYFEWLPNDILDVIYRFLIHDHTVLVSEHYASWVEPQLFGIKKENYETFQIEMLQWAKKRDLCVKGAIRRVHWSHDKEWIYVAVIPSLPKPFHQSILFK